MPKTEVTANHNDILEQIQKKAKEGLSKEKAAEMIDALQKSLIKKLDTPIRKGHYETDDFYDPEAPTNLVQLHKSAAWEKNSAIKKAQEMMDDCYLLSAILKRDIRSLNLWEETKDFIAKSELGKAMDTATPGGGTEWVPTELSRILVELIERNFYFAQEGLFTSIDMKRSPMEFYRTTGRSSAYKGAENTDITESKPTTAKSTLTAEEVCVYIGYSYTLDEESIIPLLPLLKEDAVAAIIGGTEDAIINGDISGTHMDSDVTAATDCRKLWKGLRKTTLSACKLDMSTFNYQTVLRLMQKLGKYAQPSQCFWGVGVLLAVKLLNLKDEQNNKIVQTMAELGPNATVLTGQIAVLAGSPVISSEKMREDMNASGVYDATTTDKAVMTYTRKDAFAIGRRKSVTVESDKDIVARKNKLVVTKRLIFEDRVVDTETTTALGYNIDPTV